MKKIIPREEAEKKESRNKTIISLVFVVLMVFSTAGYAFYQTGKTTVSTIKYNGNNFIIGSDGLWHFKVNGTEYATAYNPKDTENISAGNIKLDYINKPLYFSFDSDRQAADEIARNIGQFSSRMQFVCVNECNEDFPVKTCSDNIIAIGEANNTSIKQNNNCIYILSNNENNIKAADAVIFKILGITK